MPMQFGRKNTSPKDEFNDWEEYPPVNMSPVSAKDVAAEAAERVVRRAAAPAMPVDAVTDTVRRESPVVNPTPVTASPISKEMPRELTILTSSTKLKGDLISDGNIQLDGDLNGSIDCSSIVTVTGTVRGNIHASSVTAKGAAIIGNISCDGDACITGGTQIGGDISAANVSVSGRVKGNIIARRRIVLEADSLVAGDVAGDEVEIHAGAYIVGRMFIGSKEKFGAASFDRIQAMLTAAKAEEEAEAAAAEAEQAKAEGEQAPAQE